MDAGADAATEAAVASLPVLSGPRWAEARTGDGLDLARLADLEGVDRLAEVAADTNAAEEDRRAALRALAYVPDVTPGLAVLTATAVDGEPERSSIALGTLAAQAGRRAQREELEPGAWRTCAGSLKAGLGAFSGSRRALALQALLGMADRGAIARNAVPAQ